MVRFVLSETSHSGNLGGAARALKTMGFQHLGLVAPRCAIDATAHALASGADDVLQGATRYPDLDAALADCVYTVAATARPREHSPEVSDARAAALRLAEAAARGPVALVFGNETSGLSNRDIQRCDALAHIPANPAYSSLNLAAAVQVFAYEMRMACGASVPAAAGDADRAATRGEVEMLLLHAEQVLGQIGFFDPRNPKRLLQRLRRLASRARLENEEVNILRGVLNWVARPPSGRA